MNNQFPGSYEHNQNNAQGNLSAPPEIATNSANQLQFVTFQQLLLENQLSLSHYTAGTPAVYSNQLFPYPHLSYQQTNTSNPSTNNFTSFEPVSTGNLYLEHRTYPQEGYNVLYTHNDLELMNSSSQVNTEQIPSPKITPSRNKDLEADSDDSPKRKSLIAKSKESIMKNWTEKDDQLLVQLGLQYKNHWKKICPKFISLTQKKVTAHFLKTRFKEIGETTTSEKNKKFSHHEDLMIAKYFDKYKTNWALIANHLPSRTPIMIKNRYYSYIQKKKKFDQLLNEISMQEQETNDNVNEDIVTKKEFDIFQNNQDFMARVPGYEENDAFSKSNPNKLIQKFEIQNLVKEDSNFDQFNAKIAFHTNFNPKQEEIQKIIVPKSQLSDDLYLRFKEENESLFLSEGLEISADFKSNNPFSLKADQG